MSNRLSCLLLSNHMKSLMFMGILLHYWWLKVPPAWQAMLSLFLRRWTGSEQTTAWLAGPRNTQMLIVDLLAGHCEQKSFPPGHRAFITGVCPGYLGLLGVAVSRGLKFVPWWCTWGHFSYTAPAPWFCRGPLHSACLRGCVPAGVLLHSMSIDATLKISSLRNFVIFNKCTWFLACRGTKLY